MSLGLQSKLTQHSQEGEKKSLDEQLSQLRENQSIDEQLSQLGDETFLNKLRGDTISENESENNGLYKIEDENFQELKEKAPYDPYATETETETVPETPYDPYATETETETVPETPYDPYATETETPDYSDETETSQELNEDENIQELLRVEDISVTLYSGKGKEQFKKEDVVDVVNALNDPYKSNIIAFIKGGEIEDLQKYLNEEINSGNIDKDGLAEALKNKNISFDGKIKEDGKFGHQTFETLKFILEEQNKENYNEGTESLGNLDNEWVHIKLFYDIDGYIRENGERQSFFEFVQRKKEIYLYDETLVERKEGNNNLCYRVVDEKVVFGHFKEDGSPEGEFIIVDDENIRHGTVGNRLLYKKSIDEGTDITEGWEITDITQEQDILNILENKEENNIVDDEKKSIENSELNNVEEILGNLGQFDENGDFIFKDGVVEIDESGKKYLDINGDRYYEYEDNMNGLGYKVEKTIYMGELISTIYIGGYADGIRNGKGTCSRSNGEVYIGNWKDGVREGNGTLIYPNGSKYEGDWKNGLREGNGILIYPNGSKYEGVWKEGTIFHSN